MAVDLIEALDLIKHFQSALMEEGIILASPSDCDYFRLHYRTAQQVLTPVKESTPKAIAAPTPQAPKPAKKIESSTPLCSPLPVREVYLNDGYEDVRKVIAKVAPNLALFNEIPSDEMAKMIAERWKTKNQTAPFSILSYHESEPQKQLLSNLAQAIETVFGGARLISAEGVEKDKQWEAFLSVPELKLVIICDSALWQMPHLLQFYREVPSRSERFLLNTQIFLLPDLTLYLKDPLLKRSLWKALCQKIAQ